MKGKAPPFAPLERDVDPQLRRLTFVRARCVVPPPHSPPSLSPNAPPLATPFLSFLASNKIITAAQNSFHSVPFPFFLFFEKASRRVRQAGRPSFLAPSHEALLLARRAHVPHPSSRAADHPTDDPLSPSRFRARRHRTRATSQATRSAANLGGRHGKDDRLEERRQ